MRGKFRTNELKVQINYEIFWENLKKTITENIKKFQITTAKYLGDFKNILQKCIDG